MDVLFSSQTGFPLDQYGRSDFQELSGHSSTDRNSSTSYDDLLTDLSPESLPMQYNLSEGASSDQNYLNHFDIAPEFPMSNNFAQQNFVDQSYLLSTSQSYQGSSASFAPQSLTSPAESFGQSSHQEQSSRFGPLGKTSPTAIGH